MANRWEYPVRSDGKFVVDRWGIAILEVCGTDGDFHDGVVGFTKSVAASMNAAHYGDLQRQEKNIVDDDLKALDAFAERGKEMAKKLGLTVNAEATGHVIAAYINVAGQMAVANALGQLNATLRRNFFGECVVSLPSLSNLKGNAGGGGSPTT